MQSGHHPVANQTTTVSSLADAAANPSSTVTRQVPPSLPPGRRDYRAWASLGIAMVLFSLVYGEILRQWLFTDPVANTPVPPTTEASPVVADQKRATTDDHPEAVVAKDPPRVAPAIAAVAPRTAQPGSGPPEPDPDPAPSLQPSPAPATAPARSDAALEVVFADLRQRKFQLELPGRGVLRDSTEATLAALPVPARENLELALRGEAVEDLRLVRQADAPDQAPTWMVMKQAKAAFGGVENVKLGQFSLRDQQLRFQWNAEGPAWARPASIQMALLDVIVGSQQRTCQLWRPLAAPPVQIDVHKTTTVEVPLPGQLTERPGNLKVQFQVAQTGAMELPAASASVGEPAVVTLGESAETGVEVHLKLTPGEMRSSLEIKLFGSPPTQGKDGGIRSTRIEISPAVVQNHLRNGRIREYKRKEAEIEKLRVSQSNVQKQIVQKELAMKTADLASQSRLDADVDSLHKQINQIEIKIEKMEAEIAGVKEFSEKCTAWCEGVEKILQNLETSAHVQYAISVPSDPRVLVIETTGFAADPK